MALNVVYNLGEIAVVSVNFQVAGVDTDPTTLTLTYRNASGATTLTYVTDAAVVKDSTGDYHVNLATSIPGLWTGRWRGTGAAADVDEFEFFVKPARAA